jgi:hypothetical protein
MCDKCQELDKKIEQYERIAASINDQFTIDRIRALVEELRVQKAALHPWGRAPSAFKINWNPATVCCIFSCVCPGDTAMRDYRAFVMGPDGHIQDRFEFWSMDDEAAKERDGHAPSSKDRRI